MQKKLFLLLLTIYCGIGSSIAQNLTSGLWQDVPQARLDSEADRRIIPERFRSVRLDFPQLKNQTTNVPHEDRVAVKNSSFTIDIPTPDASFSTFRIVEYSMMEPELAARYPQIRTFYGYNVKSPSESIRMDMTDRGFHATYQSTGGKVYIDPYAFGDVEHYMVYYKKDYEAPDKLWECAVESHAIDTETHTGDQQLLRAGDCNFRTYRLALATTLEYSGYHGASSQAQSNLVMSAVTTTMNRVNGIFERDFAIRMLLVNNNDRIFFYQSTGDNYTNQDGGAMLGQNQTVCDNTIGSANYDIGHVFSTGGGGVAYLNSPCNNNLKAGGVTGQNAPVGDPFDVDYVAHEMGHQFGANHTQNNNCQRNGGTAMEPGSASTIMGYAGICNPNVQNNSDDHFHAVSVSEVMANVVSGVSSTCDVQTSMPNNAPTVSAGANYTIPRGTSFVLTATGSDSDGDPLTYCWEQYDNEVVAHPPQSSYTNGPAFRSFSPTTSPSRYFPNLNAIIANSSPTWEVLSDVSRTYDFRVTVRDNSTNQAGCTAEDDMRVTVTDNSGPLLVTSPNAGNEVWTETATETVTWNVANTDQAPVNATTVDILISYDGGLTYTTTLASNVPNTGTAEVQVPIGTSNTVRIMVIGHNNIFFDISNENFVIEQGAPNYLLTSDAPNQAACQGQTATYTIDVEQFLGYTDPVTLTLNNVPSG
ncbi:MAG: reprolysin-like metallopeptidase, partial [Bacteroidota bacterium]